MGLIDDLRDTSATALQRWISKSDEDVSFDDMSEALAKGGLVTAQPTEEKPRAMFHDPYSVMDWGGWRQRPSAVTYETLRQMSVANTVIRAIINLRVNQVSQFARPQQGKYDKGYRIIYRDRRDSKRAMTPVEMRKALEIERLLETTGFLLPNEKPSDRDSFRAYLKKSVQDILTYDQWCLLPGTMITMADGSLLPIEAVQPGDRVLTHKGRIRKVTEVIARPFTGTMYRIKYRGGQVEATSGHPFYVAEGRDGALKWTEAKDVRSGGYLAFPASPDLGSTDASVDEETAWILGLYTAEGFAVGKESRFSLSDYGLVERVQAWADSRGWRSVVTEDGDAAWLVRLTGNPEQSAWLADSCGRGSGQKRVPESVLRAKRSVQAHYLRGLLDGDGHWKATSCVLSTTSKTLLSTLQVMSAGLGWYLTWSKTGNEARGWSACWQARFSGEAFRNAMALAGASVGAPTQPAAWAARNVDGDYRIKVQSVESFEVTDTHVFNLEVEEDHSYVANGIVSHNCTELQRDAQGKVSRFVCLPGETIRPAVADVEHMNPEEYRSRVSHVQVYENTVIAEFGVDDIAWAVMNPRSDLRVNGFGFSYVEQVIRLVTSWLFGFDYNMRFFTQGSAVKGLLNIQGTVPDRQMRAFRRMWYSMVSGVQNAWKTPILNSENVQWINMHSTNRDMEYGAWMDFQTKMLCAVFGCDPIEINFIYGNTGQSGGLNQSRPNESEVSESKDKGLRPIVEHIQDTINRHIVWDLAPDFEFSFTGLDAKSEQAEREAMLADVRGKKMVDEIRAEDNLPPLPDGKGQVILDPTWMQFAAQADQATQGGAPGGPPGGGFGGDGGGDDQPDFGAEDGGDEEQLMSAPDKGDSMGNGLADKQDQDSMLAASFREVNEILRKARVDGERQIIDIVVR